MGVVAGTGKPGGSDHLASLDGVRGLAILIVVVHNASYVINDAHTLPLKIETAVAAVGWTGVQLFFVLSGFLITGILLASRHSQKFFRNFYIRRTLRIFPLYYAFLVGTLLLLPLVIHRPSWTTVVHRNQWWFWTYASNWGNPFGHGIPGLSHFWSLAVEEQFYLLWPLLVFLFTPTGLLRICAALVAASPIVRFLLHQAGMPPLALYEFTIARWDALAAGAIVAILLSQEPGRRWLRRYMTRIGAISSLAILVYLAVRHGFRESDLAVQILGQSLVAISSAWLILVAVDPVTHPARWVSNALSVRWLQRLGKYSYAIYVFHFPIHQLWVRLIGAQIDQGSTLERVLKLAAYIAALGAVSLAAAMVSWKAFEKPFLDLKDRFAPRPPAFVDASPSPHR